MREPVRRGTESGRVRPSPGVAAAQRGRMGGHLRLFLACMMLTPVLLTGCGHFDERYRARQSFAEANDLFTRGSYEASLDKYREIGELYPAEGDRVLFEMGIIYAYPRNERKDYGKSLDSFQRLIRDYPESGYRQDSQSMVFTINNGAVKDATIAAQKTEIENLRHEVDGREAEISALQQKVEALEKKAFSNLLRKPAVNRVLIEKSVRRLSLLSEGEVLKTYRIALGGNPVGPKERHGDNKTPEGTYVIDARNRESRYHCSLHISYPNERDKKRAREQGVSPGGNIMIHGIKNGYGWVGDAHSDADWTKGCIAVTDEEIDEIYTLVPNGTVVEIRP